VVFAYGLPDHASAGQAITGDAANITANIRIDGGAANAVDDVNPTELEEGYYVFDITAAEANGDLLSIHPTSATANVQVIGVPGAIWTRPANFNVLGIASDGDISGNVDGNVVGSVASVTGAVGSVTGAVGSVTATVAANVTQLGGVTQSLTDLKDFADLGYDPATNKVQGVVLVDTTTTNSDMRGTDSAALASNWTATRAGYVDNLNGHTAQTGDSFARLGAPVGASLSADIATVDSNVDAVLVDTNELQSDWVNGGRLDLILDELTAQGDTNETKIDTIDANVDAVLVDTNELQTDDVPGLIAALDVVVDRVELDTQDIQTRLPAALVSGRMDSNASAIAGDATAATNLSSSVLGIVSGACEGTPTNTVIQTDLAESTDDHYIGRVVVFTSGAVAGQATDITDYTGSTGTLTVTALTTAPSATDNFVIV
jgi:hypothetical protein